MTESDWLHAALQRALPPTTDMTPSRDLWPSVHGRFATSQSWSRADYVLACAVAVALLVFPDAWLVLVHQL